MKLLKCIVEFVACVILMTALGLVLGIAPALLLSIGEQPGDAHGDIAILTGPLGVLCGFIIGLGVGAQRVTKRWESE